MLVTFHGAADQSLHRAGVIIGSGAHEIGDADAEQLPEITKDFFVFVDQLLRRDSGFFGGAFDVDAVLVSAGQVGDIVAAHSFVAGDDVADDGGVGRADVGARVRVVDGSGEVILRLGIFHEELRRPGLGVRFILAGRAGETAWQFGWGAGERVSQRLAEKAPRKEGYGIFFFSQPLRAGLTCAAPTALSVRWRLMLARHAEERFRDEGSDHVVAGDRLSWVRSIAALRMTALIDHASPKRLRFVRLWNFPKRLRIWLMSGDYFFVSRCFWKA